MEEFESTPPPIPKIRNQELRHAVSALAHSADTYRQMFLKALQGESATDLLNDHLNLLKGTDAVITKWLDEFQDMDLDTTIADIDPQEN